MPALQPAVMLGHPPALVPTSTKQPPRHGGHGAKASSGSSKSSQAHKKHKDALSTVVSSFSPPGNQSKTLLYALIVALALVGLTGVAMLVRSRLPLSLRRRGDAAAPGEAALSAPAPLAPLKGDETAWEKEPEPQSEWIGSAPEPQPEWIGSEPEPQPVEPEPTPEPEPWALPPLPPRFEPAAGAVNGSNGHGNGAAHEPEREPVATATTATTVWPNGNGNANGNGNRNGNGNGNGNHHYRVSRQAAIAASGLLSLAVSRMVRGRRR